MQRESAARRLVDVAATALAYFLVAKLSLTVAIPPGYATAVWPSSGIAFALILLYGPRIAVGVWIGATAVNFSVAQALAPALAIGLGNTLEVWIAWRVARDRLSSPAEPLRTTADVIILLCASAGSSALAASVGTAALWGSETITAAAAGLTWLTWWLGDFTGMMVF